MRAAIVVIATFALLALTSGARAGGPGCQPYPIGPDSPTGIAGCVVYGDGLASWYGGDSAARNDCLYPWTRCQTIAVQSLDTGLVIVITPHMWGDLFTGTPEQRLVDLTRDQVLALGLDPSAGVFRVRVEPADADTGLPATGHDVDSGMANTSCECGP